MKTRIFLGKLGIDEHCIGTAYFRDAVPSKGELICFGKTMDESEIYEVINILYTPFSLLEDDNVECEIFVRAYNWED